jgi:hypothetical protein
VRNYYDDVINLESTQLQPVTSVLLHRRYKGFGRRTSHRSTSHDVLSTQLAFHYAWIYLDPHSRYWCTLALPTMYMYATYTRFAALNHNQIWSHLKALRPSPTQDTQGLLPSRTRDMGASYFIANMEIFFDGWEENIPMPTEIGY